MNYSPRIPEVALQSSNFDSTDQDGNWAVLGLSVERHRILPVPFQTHSGFQNKDLLHDRIINKTIWPARSWSDVLLVNVLLWEFLHGVYWLRERRPGRCPNSGRVCRSTLLDNGRDLLPLRIELEQQFESQQNCGTDFIAHAERCQEARTRFRELKRHDTVHIPWHFFFLMIGEHKHIQRTCISGDPAKLKPFLPYPAKWIVASVTTGTIKSFCASLLFWIMYRVVLSTQIGQNPRF